MTAGWNFERRRDTCARFLIGVWALSQGASGAQTSLEAVRHRMRLSPEESLFAARRLNEEELVEFEPGGAVRSNARGIARAEATMGSVRSKMQRFDEVQRTLRAKDTTLGVLSAVLRAEGGAMPCGSPESHSEVLHRLVLVGDEVTLEGQRPDGTYGAVPVDG